MNPWPGSPQGNPANEEMILETRVTRQDRCLLPCHLPWSHRLDRRASVAGDGQPGRASTSLTP